jgi:branched-chain amino acid transport system permease protein
MKLNWRTIARNGFLGGIVAFYLSAIGLTETFSERYLIGTFLSTGQLFVTVGAIMAGILTARALKEQENDRNSYVSSLLSGAISSLPLILLIILIQILVVPQIDQEVIFRWRDMFVNFSPTLVELLTFGQELVLGIPLLILVSMILAGIGAALVLLPERWRGSLLNVVIWTLGIGLFSENVTQIFNANFFSMLGGKIINRFLFQAKALNPLAAILIAVVAFIVAHFRVHKISQDRWAEMPAKRQKRGRTVGIVLGILLLLFLPWIVGQFLSQTIFNVGLFVMMGLGLNIVVGYAGLLDLGYVAFFAIGAYTMGIFTSTGELGISNLNFWETIPIAVLIGLLAGVVLGFPVLRLRGDYLAIVTLGFGEIIRIVATSDWLAPWEGGPQGVLHIPNPSFFGNVLEKPEEMYYLVIAGSLLISFITIRLKDSRLGRQWMAMREDEDVAEAMGINLVQTKLLAFSVGAGFSAMAGAVFAGRLGNIFPQSLGLIISINALSLIIVGGLGSIPGVIVGSLILVGLPELLREFTEYRFLMYGILLIVMMLFRPEGFLPDVTRKRELRGDENNFTEEMPVETEA